jgi:long-chain acyl-CoA synthetase
MGCSAQRQTTYNQYESEVSTEGMNLSGPFVKNSKKDFERAVEYFQNKTFIEEVLKTFDTHLDRQALGWRHQSKEKEDTFEEEFKFITYGDVKKMSETLARNLIRANLKSVDESTGYKFLGLYAKNCAEWTVTDLACQMMGITTVTFYATLGDLAFEHICKQTNLHTICVASDSIKSLITYKQRFGLEMVKNIIVFDMSIPVKQSQLDELTNMGFNVYSFSKLANEELSNDEIPFEMSKPDTTLTLCYTSGTTALPKGAELTQRNFIAQMVNIDDAGYHINNDSTHFSYLPLAHVMERVCILLSLIKGAKIGYITGDVRKYLSDDIRILQPTNLVAVPRVLDTFRKLIFDTFAKLPDGCKKSLVEKAIRVKKENLRETGEITHKFYDRFVFSKVREKFGGKLEVFITGSAPLSKDLADDIKILFSIPIIEGYGMTECTAAALASHFTDTSNTSAGGVISTFKLKLVDVPQMNYTSQTLLDGNASPTGEICLYGPCVFKGYYKNPEETAKTIDSNGWLHTGDVGRIMPNDQGLKIIDRVKEIFKLSQGEYIAPSKLEGIYSKSKYVLQMCVYGDSHHNHILGIIVPNPLFFKELVESQGKWTENSKHEDFYEDKDVHAAIKADLDNLAKENSFNSLEKIPKFVITSKEFTITNGCLTPTFKLVRRKVADEFKEEINRLYGK